MKIIYSQLQKFLPNLHFSARQIANKLTLLGHMGSGYEQKLDETIIGLEIRQNRGDCLGYYGIAKELATAYNLQFKVPKINLPITPKNSELPIKVIAKRQTHRIMALRISGIKNGLSPKWLQKFLKLHEINSINTLVDLTNFIMLWYGIPCHAFDTNKSGNKLVWKLNQKQNLVFQTLDKTKVKLHQNAFLISDKKGPASLVMIGGNRAKIDLNTKEVIIEVAVYDRKKVRLDAKKLNVQTEAGSRLEKDLDPDLIPQALNHLAFLILNNCGGKISSQLYDYYPNPMPAPKIKINLESINKITGIDIPPDFSKKIFKRLGCQLKKLGKNNYLAIPPSLRKDLNLKEDLVEETIRFYGYEKIPTDQPISAKKLKNITPPVLNLIKSIKNFLVNQGYDEIRSWPIIQERHLHLLSSLPQKSKPVYIENNINANFPVLRMSIASSLVLQKKQYQKYKIPDCKIFEVGKIYYQKSGKYYEKHSVAFYQPKVDQLKRDCEKLFKKLNIKKQNKYSEKIGLSEFIEIKLDKLAEQNFTPIKLNYNNKTGNAIELSQQIVDFDANIILNKKINPQKLIKKYQQKIGEKYLWKLEIVDIYQNPKTKKYKYTFRVYYYNISTPKAKQIHLKAFRLQ